MAINGEFAIIQAQSSDFSIQASGTIASSYVFAPASGFPGLLLAN